MKKKRLTYRGATRFHVKTYDDRLNKTDENWFFKKEDAIKYAKAKSKYFKVTKETDFYSPEYMSILE